VKIAAKSGLKGGEGKRNEMTVVSTNSWFVRPDTKKKGKKNKKPIFPERLERSGRQNKEREQYQAGVLQRKKKVVSERKR